MARTKTIIDYEKLSHLKKMTENKLGRTITTSKDCNDLVNALRKNSLDANINSQTVRRLFGLVKNDFSPSIYTLDLLSQYVANSFWADYGYKEQSDKNAPALADWILDYYANEKFGFTQVVDLIAESDELQNILLVKLAQFRTAHWMLFEHRPLRDHLSKKSYIKALEVYMDNKGTTEASIFVYGMLFKSALLCGNENEIEKYYHSIESIPLTKDVFNIPAARKFGVPLIYYHLKNDGIDFDRMFNEALIARNDYTLKMDYNGTNFDSTLIEHLLLVRRYEECKIVWELHLKDKEKYCTTPDSECYQQFNLLVDAYVFGQERFHKNIMKFDSNKMRVGERKYYNLFFLEYLIRFTKKSSAQKLIKLNSQLKKVIKETGYTYFESALKN